MSEGHLAVQTRMQVEDTRQVVQARDLGMLPLSGWWSLGGFRGERLPQEG